VGTPKEVPTFFADALLVQDLVAVVFRPQLRETQLLDALRLSSKFSLKYYGVSNGHPVWSGPSFWRAKLQIVP
jgi:hypothetical protein